MPKAPTQQPKSSLSEKLKKASAESKAKKEQSKKKGDSKKEKKKSGSKVEKKSKSTKKKKTSLPAKEKSTTKKPRPVVYTKVEMRLCDKDNPITVDQAKKLLGWEVESENIKFGSDYLLKDLEDNKVRCLNNTTNRPMTSSNYKTLMSEILHRNWCMNGEPIIIGQTGNVLNGQHTLVALVLAAQEWEARAGTWKEYWKVEPILEKIVVTGISEDDKVVNTIDTPKLRTLTDVIFRSAYFAKHSWGDRNKMAKMTDHAIKFLWDRTSAYKDAYAPKRTHAESLDFLDRHPKLLEVIAHIFEENDNGKIGRFCSPGYSAGLLYLMAATEDELQTDEGTGYADAAHPSEKQLSLAYYDKACEFFVLLAGDNAAMEPVVEAIATVVNEGHGFAERIGTLVLAWEKFVHGKKIKVEHLALSFETEKDEDTGETWEVLADIPIVGGIDTGGAAAAE